MPKLPYLIDVPVLMIFFVRPETFQQVFNRVREARPSKLYLCQDGQRNNRPDDVDNIKKCRQIVENIDWECEVHRNYSDINLGCDPNVYRGLKWIFEHEDRMIMLEDDSVPALSYFALCEQLLEKYNNDTRVSLISSFNLVEKWDVPSDYFFTLAGTLSGCWSTWKRVWEERDETLDFVKEKDFKRLFYNYYLPLSLAISDFNDFKRRNIQFKMERMITSFEVLIGSARLLHNGLTIMPSKNMNCNIGMTANATHGSATIKHLSKKLQKVFFMKVYELPCEIVHPRFMIPDIEFSKKISNILGLNPFVSFLRKIEMKIRRIIYR